MSQVGASRSSAAGSSSAAGHSGSGGRFGRVRIGRADLTVNGLRYFMEHQIRRTPALLRSTLVNGVVNPAFFLVALGVGLGTLVDRGDTSSLGTPDYLAFVGPGLLATTAMQWAVGESLWATVAAVKWEGFYKAAVTTPTSIDEVATGHLLWIVVRFLVAAVLFTAMLAIFGVTQSWWVVLAPLAAALTAAAFAALVSGFSAPKESDQLFPLVMRLGVIPMFLFSGAFFPISDLPVVVGWVARLTPAWHGVQLCRGLSLGNLGAWAALVHVGYLVVLTTIGWRWCRVSFRTALAGAGSAK